MFCTNIIELLLKFNPPYVEKRMTMMYMIKLKDYNFAKIFIQHGVMINVNPACFIMKRITKSDTKPSVRTEFNLPTEIFGEILLYMTHQEQFDLRLVCIKWNKIISTNKFYQQPYSYIEMCTNNKFMSFDKYNNDPGLIKDDLRLQKFPEHYFSFVVPHVLLIGYSICIHNKYNRLSYLIKCIRAPSY